MFALPPAPWLPKACRGSPRREIPQPQKVTLAAVWASAWNGIGRHIPFRINQPPLEARSGHKVALLWLSSARQQRLNGKRGGPWLVSALSGTRVFRFESPRAWLRPLTASRGSKQDLSPSAATSARAVRCTAALAGSGDRCICRIAGWCGAPQNDNGRYATIWPEPSWLPNRQTRL